MGLEPERPSVFLVQVSEAGSTNILKNNKYHNDKWQSKPRDKAHGLVREGDFLLVYFAGGAIEYQKQLKLVLKVSGVSDKNIEFKTEIFQEINRPLTRDEILEEVSRGILSDRFLNCGRQGFNICKIEYSDYEKVLQISGTLPPLPVTVGAESLLEDFIFNNWRPSQFFGEEYSSLEVMKDDNGDPIGQQYDTHGVGIIDLLCIDKKSGGYCVIEIKKGTEIGDQVVGQLARYMGWVKKNLAGDKGVIGIIIASGHDEKTRYAASVIPDMHLAIYEVNFKIRLLEPRPTQI